MLWLFIWTGERQSRFGEDRDRAIAVTKRRENEGLDPRFRCMDGKKMMDLGGIEEEEAK